MIRVIVESAGVCETAKAARNVAVFTLFAAGQLLGCSSHEPGSPERGAAGEAPSLVDNDTAAAGAGGARAEVDSPVYVVADEIFAKESTSYVTLLRSLDVSELDLTDAIEFGGGRATIATRGGYVYVAPPDAPEIRRFAISEAGLLVPDGVLSFLHYGLESASLDEWGNTFISDDKAYLHNLTDGTSVIWNPRRMVISGEVDVSDFELVRPELGELNGSSGLVRDGRLFRTIFWSNWEEQRTSQAQYLAVYDTDADRLIALDPEERCPGLSNLVSRDESGAAYFSNWIWNVGETVLRDAPQSCVLRLPADSERFDPDFTLRYADLTDGREGAVFSYLADGAGIMSVFYPERSPTTDGAGPSDVVEAPAWKLWSVDLSGKAAPLPGLDWMLGAVTPLRLDGRSLLMVPGEDWAIIHVHELVDGRLEPRFDISGWSYQFLKVR